VSARPLYVGAALVVGVVAALVYAAAVMGAPRSDVQQIALILSLSGAGSLLASAAIVRWGAGLLGSLRLRFALAYGMGLAVAVVNVYAASSLMFLNSHDFAFLLLLLGFAAVVSLAFGYSVTSALLDQLGALARSAGRLAAGDLGARVGARGTDEVARLAATFDHMAAQLQGSFERERELEASRRDLIAAVSHDLRTPLATTRAMVEAILDGVVTDEAEVRRYLHLVRGEVQHLSRLIDDLFELSQIESGSLKLRLAPTRLPDLLTEALEPYRARARDGGIELVHQAAPGIPEVRADAARLQRVLRNLVDNALHYTPSGGRVRVEARADGGAVHVLVSDTGPGVPPDDLERVFDRFYRGERARSRGDSGGRLVGAGLGLAIARGLVQAHGGRIWAESSGGGAVFHFTVPVAAR
jgi:signal transduction histidine kinase